MNVKKQSAESKVKEIRRHIGKKYSAEEKIRIVIEGLRGERSIAELCLREGINPNLYYNWSNFHNFKIAIRLSKKQFISIRNHFLFVGVLDIIV